MNLISLLSLPFRYKPWRPHHAGLVLSDIFGTARQQVRDHETHLTGAIEWLLRAQDRAAEKGNLGGVSAGWSFEDGWLPTYPETSGYIIETFIAAAQVLDRPTLLQRAELIVDWELSIQNADGSFPGHFGKPSDRPVIFNTGQIIHGMLAGYIELSRQECLEAAVRAGYWMVQRQDEDGCWRRSVHNGIPHTYNTRAAWALLRTGLISGDKVLVNAAQRNIFWALTQQTESGWFANNAFTAGRTPFTHTIAYAIRGMLECGILLENERFISGALRAAQALAAQQRNDGWLAGTYDDGWVSTSRYCCLTGLAQMIIIWKRFSKTDSRGNFTDNVTVGLQYLKSNHQLKGDGSPEDGGIAGSAPIWGRYSMFEYPNWAVKFFADALMMEMSDVVIPSERLTKREAEGA